jgi:hypothetical protein
VMWKKQDARPVSSVKCTSKSLVMIKLRFDTLSAAFRSQNGE